VEQVEHSAGARADRVSEGRETQGAAVEGETLEFGLGYFFLAAPLLAVLGDADEETVFGVAVLVAAHIMQ